MAEEKIIVKGARVHNLKNIDVEMPRDQFIVITGLSGSGKSSLAFDTIYAEGQRRYVESLSAYARQFLGLMERPDVDYIEGLSPSISIEQKTVSTNPRSTVGTVTEIYDFLRLLFARVGTQFCYNCGRKVQRQTIDQIIDSLLQYPAGAKMQLLAPVVKGRKGHYRELFEQILKDGFVRVRIDGEIKEIKEGLKVDRYKIHNIEIVVDRLTVKKDARARVAESVEVALRYGNGALVVFDGEKDHLYSSHYACHICGISYEEPSPSSFSFNSPAGSCPECEGLGEKKAFDLRLIIPDETKSINEEGLAALGKPRPTWMFSQIRAVAKRHGFTFDTPLKDLSASARQVLLHGGGDEKFEIEYTQNGGRSVTYRHRYGGVMDMLKRLYDESNSNSVREWVESFMTTTRCESCGGGRLRKESLAIRLEDSETGKMFNVPHVVSLSIRAARAFFSTLSLAPRQAEIARPILKEITQRLDFMLNVGLDYLTLDRTARSLSGGEGQRIRLATQIGTQLVGVLYILDEPSIGLHQRDNIKLINSLKSLRDLGNTIIVVEHDKETILSADYVIDLGPGAGEHGGFVVTSGAPQDLAVRNDRLKRSGNGFGGQSLTALYLKGKRTIEIPAVRRKGNGKWLTLGGASGNNLRNLAVKIPLGRFVCVTGVSGSGKSTLINETLYPILSNRFYRNQNGAVGIQVNQGIGTNRQGD